VAQEGAQGPLVAEVFHVGVVALDVVRVVLVYAEGSRESNFLLGLNSGQRCLFRRKSIENNSNECNKGSSER
jgi:hypothetical protein